MVNERVRMIRKRLEMTQDQLAQRLGIGKAALSMIETGKAGLSTRNLNIFVQEFNVNPEWVESGRGEMFTAEPAVKQVLYGSAIQPGSQQNIPLYSLDQAGGLSGLLQNPQKVKPLDYIYVPNLPKCDGAIFIMGDSMYPLLKSGDIVMYKHIVDLNDIFWGDMYLFSIDIDGEEYVTVKYIHKSDTPGCVKLVSQNLHHADKDVSMERIRALAVVKASVRVNSIR